MLVHRAQGNAFFLEEMLSALADQGALERILGGYAVVRDARVLEVPASVRTLLADRIDRLQPEEREVLRAAAVIGDGGALRLLESVTTLPPRAFRAAVRRLIETGFLLRGGSRSRPTYAFRHGLTQEVAYAEILHRQRRMLHARVVELVEASANAPGDRRHTAEPVEMLAGHAARAELWPALARYARRAGQRAAARDSNSEAARYFEQALLAVSHLPQTPENQTLAIDLRFDLRSPFHRLGRIAESGRHFEQAKPIAVALGDVRREAMLCVYQGHIDWLGGQYRRAIEALRAGEALAGKAGDRATGAQALFHIGIVRMLLGEFEPAVRDMRVALEHVRDHERQGLPFRAFSQGDVLNYIARALAELGVFDAAHQAASKALAAGTRTRGRYERVLPSAAIGVVHYLQGDMAAAETWLERSVVDCREAETPLLTAVSLGYLGAVQVRAGRAADGLRTVTAAVESADQMGFLALQALRLSFLAEAHLACGNLPAALRVADRSLQLAIQTGERGSQAHALFVRGSAEAAAGRTETARSFLTKALQQAQLLGMRPLANRCLQLLAGSAPTREPDPVSDALPDGRISFPETW